MGGADQHVDILFLTHNYPRHATDFAGRFVARLATLVQERNGRVAVLAPHHPGAAIEENLDGIDVRRFRYGPDESETVAYRGELGRLSLSGPGSVWAQYRFLRSFAQDAKRLVAFHNPSVLHAHWWLPAGWVARRHARGRRLIVTLHGTDLRLLRQKAWLRPLAARVFERAAIITTVSTWLADTLRAISPASAEKIRVAPMPPDDTVFTPASGPPVVNDPSQIVCVTRFTAQKRNAVLIDALARLHEQGIAFRCRVIGDGGPLRSQTAAQIERLGLSAEIELVGSVPQSAVADAYRGADVAVLAAVDEGFGMALLEAQLCGCAVVGVRSGGFPDIITHEQSGLLARPDDADDLAAALARLLHDRVLKARLAQGGFESARGRFSSRVIVDRFIGWYKGTE